MKETSGNAVKQDVVVHIIDDQSPLKIVIKSTVEGLFGKAIRKTAESELIMLRVINGTIKIDDNQALDFVIRARIQAAVTALRNKGGVI